MSRGRGADIAPSLCVRETEALIQERLRCANCVGRENGADAGEEGCRPAGGRTDESGKRLSDGAEGNGDGEGGAIVVDRQGLRPVGH